MSWPTRNKVWFPSKDKAHENQTTQIGHTETCQDIGTSYPTSCMNICFSKSEANIQIPNKLFSFRLKYTYI